MNATNFHLRIGGLRLCFTLLILSFFTAQSQAQISTERMTRDDRAELFTGFSEEDVSEERTVTHASPVPTGNSQLKTNACAAGFIMNTPYNSNNGQRGCMFDILAANTVTIRCFESNLYAGTTGNYEIYYRAGTHVGFENNAAAWTFLGGATGITSAGNNVPTALPIPINVVIPAGQTYSFYITNDFGAGTSYTDGTAVGNFLANDANLTVFEGVGKSYPFGLTFNVRNFNGHIFYDLGSVLDGESAQLDGNLEGDLAQLEWMIPSHATYTEMVLESSQDGLRFEDVEITSLAASGQWEGLVPGTASTTYFRLRLLDQEGNRFYSNTLALSRDLATEIKLESVYPNPFSNELNLSITKPAGVSVKCRLVNAMGGIVATYKEAEGPEATAIHWIMPDLPAGVYILVCQTPEQQITRRVIHQ